MKVVLQRVVRAQVDVEGACVGKIKKGVLVFLGVSKKDTQAEARYLVQKIIQLRIFEDEQGKMNLSAKEAGGAFLVVSQFTLYGNCDKGRRPSFDEAAGAQQAEDLYQYFVEEMRAQGQKVETGKFKAMMDVELVNDGPVTFVLEK